MKYRILNQQYTQNNFTVCKESLTVIDEVLVNEISQREFTS